MLDLFEILRLYLGVGSRALEAGLPVHTRVPSCLECPDPSCGTGPWAGRRRRIQERYASDVSSCTPDEVSLGESPTDSKQTSRAFKSEKLSFIDHYVFPDGKLLALTEMVHAAEEAGFKVRDVEDLRQHYEETLHRWMDALCKKEQEAIELTIGRPSAHGGSTWRVLRRHPVVAIAIHQFCQ